MKKYIQVIKPGIIFSNLLASIGGFYFSGFQKLNLSLLFFLLLGLGCIIASGCILNNIIDINIDKKMIRTKNRLLVQHPKYIFYYKILSVLTFIIGILIFLLKINLLSVLLSIIAFFTYVILYSFLLKRKSKYSILIGSISGSLPTVIGYCSITNNIDLKSILLFLIYFFWQFAHVYSILIFYERDYQNAHIPNIVNEYGKLFTIKNIIIYIILFSCLNYVIYIFNFIQSKYCYLLFILDIIWLYISYLCYFYDKKYYSRLLFIYSIIVIVTFNIILIIN